MTKLKLIKNSKGEMSCFIDNLTSREYILIDEEDEEKFFGIMEESKKIEAIINGYPVCKELMDISD